MSVTENKLRCSPKPDTIDWLKGGAEMGNAIREFDWSQTSLGARTSWPQSLRVALGLCLNSRFPMFLWWGPDLVNLHNDAYIPILGKRHTGALGAQARELWKDIWPSISLQVEAVFERGEPSWNERLLLVTNRNGYEENAYFTYSHSPVFDEAGKVAGLICVVSEETAHVCAEEKLRKSEELCRRVLESSNDCIKVLDLDGNIEMMSEGGQRAFGISDTSQFLGKCWVSFWQGEHGEAAGQAMEMAKNGQVGSFEGYCPTFTGDERWWSLVLSPMLDSTGRPEKLVCISRDITARRQSEAAMRASQQRLERVLETDAVGVLFFDQTGTIIQANEGFLRMTGYTQEDIEGGELTWRRLTPEEWVPVSEQQMQQLAETGRIGPYEKEYIHKDGSRSWMLFAGRDLGDGTTSEYCINITERKRAEEALRVSEAKYRALFESLDEGRKELERANRELEEFAYVASHDLQEPLRMVNIYTQLLMRGFVGNDPTAELYAGFVKEGVTRMERLISDLLAYSRVGQTDEVETGTADLSAALNEAISVLKHRIEETGALIIAGPLPMVRGDTLQIAQVFQNLLSNALNYRRKDVAPEIHISATLEGAQWKVSVQDNGIGFEQQYAKRIFGLFKRLHKAEYPGTGLGLAICQRIVERYGGEMRAEGRPGEGATLYFSLPPSEV